MKDVLITGGGDWNDASAEMLAVNDDLDMKLANKEYRAWFQDGRQANPKFPYLSFVEWLRKFRGAQDSQVEEYREDW